MPSNRRTVCAGARVGCAVVIREDSAIIATTSPPSSEIVGLAMFPKFRESQSAQEINRRFLHDLGEVYSTTSKFSIFFVEVRQLQILRRLQRDVDASSEVTTGQYISLPYRVSLIQLFSDPGVNDRNQRVSGNATDANTLEQLEDKAGIRQREF